MSQLKGNSISEDKEKMEKGNQRESHLVAAIVFGIFLKKGIYENTIFKNQNPWYISFIILAKLISVIFNWNVFVIW